jgi:hypothetical protein
MIATRAVLCVSPSLTCEPAAPAVPPAGFEPATHGLDRGTIWRRPGRADTWGTMAVMSIDLVDEFQAALDADTDSDRVTERRWLNTFRTTPELLTIG